MAHKDKWSHSSSMERSVNCSLPPVKSAEAHEIIVKKLGREVFKFQEHIKNIMDKLVVINGKIENIAQPSEAAATSAGSLAFLPQPLKEVEEMKALEEALKNKDNYYQLVKTIHSLGGVSVRDALKRAWYGVFSIKVMAFVNWETMQKKGLPHKQELKHSIITTAVFAGVKANSRLPDQFEMENKTKKIMKWMPEKYRKRSAAENAAQMENGDGREDYNE